MKNQLLTALLCFFTITLFSQNYITEPQVAFTRGKVSYVTLNDGTELEQNFSKIKYKKGLITMVVLKDEDGNKKEYLAEDIKSMYLPVSGLGKLAAGLNQAGHIKNYDTEDVNKSFLKEGYAYFESHNTQIRKKKEGVVLLQLLNPAAASKIKIFYDPFAQESASVGVGGMTMAGGLAKSYFVKVNDDKVFRLKKKDYKDEFANMYSDCPSFEKEFEKIKWSELGEHIFKFTEMCE